MTNLERLIVEFKDSLEQDSGSLRQAMDGISQTMQRGFSRINDSFDRQRASLCLAYSQDRYAHTVDKPDWYNEHRL